MKFFKIVLAMVTAMVAGGDAARPQTKQEWKKTLDYRMKNGLFDKETLMKGAKPYSEAAKKRELQYGEITGAYSVQFQSCFSFTTSYEELFNDDTGMMMSMFQNGNLVALKSYAIFKLCYNGQCSSNDGSDMLMEYLVDLNTYVQALVQYLPEKMEEFCEGCQENAEQCYAILYGAYAGAYAQNGQQMNYMYQSYNAGDNSYNGNANNVNSYWGNNNNGGYQGGYGQGGNQQGGYQQGYNNNGQAYNDANGYNNGNNGYNRRLEELRDFEHRVLQNGQVVKQLDCTLCEQYQCLSDEQNQYQNDMFSYEAASEWLQELAECSETEVNYYGGNNGYYGNANGGGDLELYAGFICNAEGTGVEIGLFMDDECTLYLSNEPYENYMNYYDSTYAEMTKEIIEFTFSNAILSCKDEEIVYTTQDISGYSMYNYQDYNWNGDDEMADWCQQLIEGGDSVAVDINSCGMYNADQYYDQWYYENYGQNWEEKYDEYRQEDEQMQYMYMYDWYRYDISEEDAYDMYAVCKELKANAGDLHTFYNNRNGQIYNYGSANQASENITQFLDETGQNVTYEDHDFLYSVSQMSKNMSERLSGAAKFGIVAGTGIIVGAAIALFLRYRKAAEEEKEFTLMDDGVST